MKRRTVKRKKALAEKKRRKAEAMRRPGDSKYAQKARRNARGNFGPGSPFRSVVTVEVDDAT